MLDRILPAAGALATALTGSEPGITLGGIAFDGFELPESVPWGGEQRLTVHKLPGGARVVDAMGPDDRPITWSGVFHGPDASGKARAVDAMRVSGSRVDLIWGDEIREVLVSGFEADYAKSGFWIPYRVTCLVIPSDRKVPRKPSLLESLGIDLSWAADVADTVGPVLDVARDAVDAARALLPVAGVLTRASPEFLGVSNAISKASGGLGAASSLMSGRFTEAAGGIRAATYGTQLSGIAGSATALSGMVDSRAHLGSALARLRDAGT